MNFFTVNNKQLEGCWFDPPDTGDSQAMSYPIVLLHEGLGCVQLWRHFPSQLARHLNTRVFAYSRVGYGNSSAVDLPRPASYMHDEARTYLGPLLDQLAIDQVVLLGHSDGASIATIYAGESQDPRLRALVLIAPHLFVENISLTSIATARESFDNGDLRDRLMRYHGTNVDGAFNGWCDAWLDESFGPWDISDCARNVTVSTLVLQGENDEYGTIAQIERVQSSFAGSVLTQIIEDCGHAPPFEQPKVTLAAIRQFLKELG